MPSIDEDTYKILEKYALTYGVSLGYVENVYLNMITPRVSSEEILQKLSEVEFKLKGIKSGLKSRMLYLKSRGIVPFKMILTSCIVIFVFRKWLMRG